MSRIEQLDILAFQFINQTLSSELLDALLIPIRYQLLWVPVYVFIIAFILFNKAHFHWGVLAAILLTMGLSDLTSSSIIKPTIKRPRPCHVDSGLENINLRVRCGRAYSFTSSHATNHFCLSTLLFLFFGGRRKRWFLIFFTWAGLISIAQVYVGVHYPLDISVGAILGILIANIGYWFYHKLNIQNKSIA